MNFYKKNSKIQIIASPTKSVNTIDFDSKATKIAIRAAKILGLFKTIEFSWLINIEFIIIGVKTAIET